MSFFKAPTVNFFSTTLNGSINDSVQTITLNSVTGLQAPGVIIIDREDGNGVATPNSREVVSFTGISGSDLTGCTRNVDGSGTNAHSNGALVETTFTVGMWNELRDAVAASLTTDGAGIALSGTASIATLNLGNFLSTPRLAITSVASIARAQLTDVVISNSINTSGASMTGIDMIPRRVRAYKNANQSINNTTITAVTFNQETFDNDTMHDNSTNPSRITIKTAGVYLFKAQVAFANNSTGLRQVFFYKNGSAIYAQVSAEPMSGGDRTVLQITVLVEAAVNDYFEVFAQQGSGGALNLEGAASDPYYGSNIEAIRLGASS